MVEQRAPASLPAPIIAPPASHGEQLTSLEVKDVDAIAIYGCGCLSSAALNEVFSS